MYKLLVEELRSERIRGMVQITTPYFPHSSLCKFSNILRLHLQPAVIPLKLNYFSQNLTVPFDFTRSLVKWYLRIGGDRIECFRISLQAADIKFSLQLASCWQWDSNRWSNRFYLLYLCNIWSLKVMFYYICHLPRFDETES